MFSKQHDAIEFVLNKHGGELNVFAFEVDSTGKRNFLAAHPENLWSFYKHLKLPQKHFYEVIPEGRPCKIYFDLEYKIDLNQSVDGENMLKKFVAFLVEDIKTTFDVAINARKDVIDLISSTAQKFSHHVIVNHKKLIFANNYHVGAYVKFLCYKMKQKPEFELTLDRQEKFASRDINEKVIVKGIFVDEGVYTKNRNFRMYLSSKFNKNVCLSLNEKSNEVQMNSEKRCKIEERVFLDSLVTYIHNCYATEMTECSLDKINNTVNYITFDVENLLPKVERIDSFMPTFFEKTAPSSNPR